MLAPDFWPNAAKSVGSMALPIAIDDSMLPRNEDHSTVRTLNDNATKVATAPDMRHISM